MLQSRIRPDDPRAKAFRWLERRLRAGVPAVQTWITGDGSQTTPMPQGSAGQVICRLTVQPEPVTPFAILGGGGRSFAAPILVLIEATAPGLTPDDWLAIQQQIETSTPTPTRFRTTDPYWRDAKANCVNGVEWVQPLTAIGDEGSTYGGSVRLEVYITR